MPHKKVEKRVAKLPEAQRKRAEELLKKSRWGFALLDQTAGLSKQKRLEANKFIKSTAPEFKELQQMLSRHGKKIEYNSLPVEVRFDVNGLISERETRTKFASTMAPTGAAIFGLISIFRTGDVKAGATGAAVGAIAGILNAFSTDQKRIIRDTRDVGKAVRAC